MVALKNMETFTVETYTNWELSNSMQALWEKKTATEKKVDIILHFWRIIIKSDNPDIIKNYFLSENIRFEEDKETPVEEIKYLVKEKLETLENEKLDEILNYFKIQSWKILTSHPINTRPNKIKANHR
jgi:2,3-bisphosphoglycerate-independent phosphoglycerate mutase